MSTPVQKPSKKAKKAKKAAAKAESSLIKQEVKTLAQSATALRQQIAVANSLNSISEKHGKKILKAQPELLAYIRALIDPESVYRTQGSVRVPDAFSRATATVNSYRTYPVYGNVGGSSAAGDLGRFCFVSNPTLTSEGWVYSPGPTVLLYGGVPTYGQATSVEDTLSLGANLARLNPETNWQPWFSMQPQAPAPSKEAGSKDAALPPKTSSGKSFGGRAFAPPPIPTQTAWQFFADPNAVSIGGAEVYNQIAANNLQYSGGAAESIRPVAHCLWFEPTLNSLADGGNVSITLLPPDALLGQIAPLNFLSATDDAGLQPAQWQGQGPLQNWENLAQVPASYNGPLKKGAYCFWLPSKISDIDMTSVATNCVANFPTIVVSGQWNGNPSVPGDSVTDQFTGLIGKVRVTTLYEYTTCAQDRATRKSVSVPGMFEFVQHLMKHQPTAMENSTHRSWIDKVLATAVGLAAGVGGFLVGGPPGALAAGTAAGSATLALLQ